MKRVFISFDYDHDQDLKNALVAQARIKDSPFEIADYSVKEEVTGDWKQEARQRIRRAHLVIAICGTSTDTASGVKEELRIAKEEGIPYVLLWGRSDKQAKKPLSALQTDKIYKWTWDNLKSLIEGAR